MDIFAGDIEIDLPPEDDEDPHVRVVGDPEAVRIAGAMVRDELEPQSKITLKLDVSWVHHSHLIGKGGNNIQPIVKRTGVSIHFPDGNKNSEVRKSNLVSINSRGDDLTGLEEARAYIRNLTPVIFSFSLCASAQFINIPDPDVLLDHVQTKYHVQVDLKVTDDITPLIVGMVRGTEFEVVLAKEATHCILQAYCDTLANQMPVQMSMEISPQHHSFIVGRNQENLKRIMHRTATKITFPDTSDEDLSPLKKSTVVISGAIDNVYLARQNIMGCLPLVLMFELLPDQDISPGDIAQVTQSYGVSVLVRNRKQDGRQLVLIKGAEKNADDIYGSWKVITKADNETPKANIPPNYHISDAAPLYGLNMSLSDLKLGQWLNTDISPSTTPLPPTQLHSSLLWGGGASSPPPLLQPQSYSHQTSYQSRSPYNPFVLDPAPTYYTNNFLMKNGGMDGYNNNCSNGTFLPKTSLKAFSSGMNLNSMLTGMTLSNSADVSCGTSSNSGSSLSSPAPSPRNPSPDQGTMQYGELDSPSKMGIKALSVLMSDFERRAPGCERKRMELEHQKLSDYNSKKLLAAKAMKEQVTADPRTPTSNWSGYGFSKSMPGFMIRQKMQENNMKKNSQEEPEKWDCWQTSGREKLCFPSGQGLSNITYPPSPPSVSGVTSNLCNGKNTLGIQKPSSNLSASNLFDCVLPRPCTLPPSKKMDISSILADIQLEQYIDVFAAQEVDLGMFLTLDDMDLKELGIKIFGHRKRILMVIKNLARKQPLM